MPIWKGRKTRPVRNDPRTTEIIAAPFYRFKDAVTLTVAGNVGDTSVWVDDVSQFTANTHLILTDTVTGEFHICDVIGDVYASNEVPIDTPLGTSFGVGTNITVGDHDMRTPIGSLAAPITYQVRSPAPLQSPISYDVYRIMLLGITTGVGDLAHFGDGDPLVNGLVLRVKRSNGTYHNIGNAKTNGELKQMMYDFDLLSASNPQQGANGVSGRFTLEKLGGVVRLEQGDDLEILVQDDLTTRVLEFGILTQGGVAQ